MTFKFSDLTLKRLRAFKKNRVAMASLVLLALMLVGSAFAPVIANRVPIAMRYHGKLYFPVLREPTAAELGIEGAYLVDYQALSFASPDWVVRPVVRYDPYESNVTVASYPSAPTRDNWFGTDDRGRDVFARLLYGFRYSFVYSLGVWILTYLVGVSFGLVMGFFGGKIDFFGQRIVEILSSVPQFFLLIILISIFEPSLALLVAVSSVFGWIPISYYMRAEGLKLRKLEFVEAARALGVPTRKIVFKHVLPNALTPIVTFSPFAIAAGITGLAALDYLGFGLTPPTPSWGELLNQAKKYFTVAWWLAFYPSFALFSTLTLLNFVGEGLRNAFDPKA